MMERIGDCLKRMRSEHGLTQEEVVEHLFVTQPTYSQYESGGVNPPLVRLQALAHLYHCEVGVFLELMPRNKRRREHQHAHLGAGFLPMPIAPQDNGAGLREAMQQCAADMQGLSERLEYLIARLPGAEGA